MKASITNKKAQSLLEGFEELAGKLNVRIRYERLAQGPVRSLYGSCRLREENLIIIDSRMNPSERLGALSQELARFDLEDVFVPPAVREYFERGRGLGKVD